MATLVTEEQVGIVADGVPAITKRIRVIKQREDGDLVLKRFVSSETGSCPCLEVKSLHRNKIEFVNSNGTFTVRI